MRINQRYKSRKFWGALVLVILETSLLLNGHISSEIWADMVKWTFTAFVLGNVGEHFSESKKNEDF